MRRPPLANTIERDRGWEIWAFGAAFIALFFLFASATSGPEPARAVPIAEVALHRTR